MKKSIMRIFRGGIVLPLLLTAGPALAASCLNGGCHQSLVTPRHLHGPVAAEMAGATGCIACHTPKGKVCSKNQAGEFTFDKKGKEMCLLCHGAEMATEHTTTQKNCLRCHNPHGSSKSSYMLREDQ